MEYTNLQKWTIIVIISNPFFESHFVGFYVILYDIIYHVNVETFIFFLSRGCFCGYQCNLSLSAPFLVPFTDFPVVFYQAY